jgi:hypothetical protein
MSLALLAPDLTKLADDIYVEQGLRPMNSYSKF